MNVGQICQRNAITVTPSDELRTAAKLMREHHIGFLVVVTPAAEGEQEPIGVITDRDIVVETLAVGVDADSVSVGDVMTCNPTVALLEDSIVDALSQMRHRGVRRLPVVGDYGKLVGVVSLDDILRQHADEIGTAAAVIANGQRRESHARD